MANTLHIYRAPSGQWAGKVLEDGVELGRVGGCESPEEVEEAALDNGLTFDAVTHENMAAAAIEQVSQALTMLHQANAMHLTGDNEGAIDLEREAKHLLAALLQSNGVDTDKLK